jgi:hypothetical protein
MKVYFLFLLIFPFHPVVFTPFPFFQIISPLFILSSFLNSSLTENKKIVQDFSHVLSSLCFVYVCVFVLYLRFLTYFTPWSRVLLETLTGFEANREIRRVLCNPKFHYRTHKHPPPVPNLRFNVSAHTKIM